MIDAVAETKVTSSAVVDYKRFERNPFVLKALNNFVFWIVMYGESRLQIQLFLENKLWDLFDQECASADFKVGKGARKDLYPYMFKTVIDLIGYLNYLERTKGKKDSF